MDEELNIDATVEALGQSIFSESAEERTGKVEPEGQKALPAPAAAAGTTTPPAAAAMPAPPKPDPAIAATPEKVDEPAETPAAPAPTTPDDPLGKPPKTWKAEAAAGWETLSPAHRAEIHRREEDFYKGIEGFKERAARGDAFERTIAPFMPALRHYGIDPHQQIAGLMNAHMTLALGHPDQKLALFQKLAADYRVPLDKLSSSEGPFTDPQVQALQDRIRQLESTQATNAQSAMAAQQKAISDEIEAFAKDPANQYFEQVQEDMAVLIKGSGGKMTLKDAYDRAVWANPSTRALEESRRVTEAVKKRDAEAKEAAERAAKANAANVKTLPKKVSPTAATGSIDDTLRETFQSIQSRG